MRIPRASSAGTLPPGHWAPLNAGRSAWVKCPNGHLSVLDGDDNVGHTINRDGHVYPSVVCPAALCDWHVDDVVLESWP